MTPLTFDRTSAVISYDCRDSVTDEMEKIMPILKQSHDRACYSVAAVDIVVLIDEKETIEINLFVPD